MTRYVHKNNIYNLSILLVLQDLLLQIDSCNSKPYNELQYNVFKGKYYEKI